MENKNKVYIWIALGVVIVAVVVYMVISGGGFEIPGVTESQPEGVKTDQGTVVVPGTSAINDEGMVVTTSGAPAKNDAIPGSPEAPQQSAPIAKEDVPAKAIKLTMTASGFSPKTFDVKSGEIVTLAVTSGDTQTHVFMFDDSSLSAVATGVGPGETRAITFNAPSSSGEYSFRCDVPGHSARGEVGKMIVK